MTTLFIMNVIEQQWSNVGLRELTVAVKLICIDVKTKESSLEVAPTTLATFSCRVIEFWLMTLTY